MKKCSKCGATYSNQAEYCQKDGTKLSLIESPKENVNLETFEIGVVVQTIAVIILVVGLILCYNLNGLTATGALVPFCGMVYLWGEKLKKKSKDN